MDDSPASPPQQELPASTPSDDSEPDGVMPPEFDPVPLRPRFDGWTAERQAMFIQALAESACVADACRAVGMSERSAYALRARVDAVSFRNAWETALDYGIRRLSDAVLSRAINGVATPVFYKGEQVGERLHFNDRLAMFLLRYRDPLRYGKWVDHRDHFGHPEGAAGALTEAKVAVREDADLLARDIPGRIVQRMSEIKARLLGD